MCPFLQAGVWQGLHLQEERSPEEYAFVSSAAKEVANAAKRYRFLNERITKGI